MRKWHPILLIVLFSTVALLSSCDYPQHVPPGEGEAIVVVPDPNAGISRDLDGNRFPDQNLGGGKIVESCSYGFSQIPARKSIMTRVEDGVVKEKTFTTEAYGTWKVVPYGGGFETDFSFTRKATTDELSGNLIELSYLIENNDTGIAEGRMEVHPALLSLLPDSIPPVLKKTPKHGTREIGIKNERSYMCISVELMPQDLAEYFFAEGLEDTENWEIEGRRYEFRFDNGLIVNLSRRNRILGNDDMTDVYLSMPTDFFLENIIPDFILEGEK